MLVVAVLLGALAGGVRALAAARADDSPSRQPATPPATQPDSLPGSPAAGSPSTAPATRPDAARKPASSRPAAPSRSKPGKKDADSPVRQAIEQLTAEAQESKAASRLQHSESDLKRRTVLDIAPAELFAALSQRAHRDPFIDAYIRWQLTSLAADGGTAIDALQSLDDRQFSLLLTNLPALIENPRADSQAIAMFEAVDQKVQRPADLARLREAAATLEDRVARAEAFNVPALGLRDWLAAVFAGNPARLAQLDLERCAATIKAGWPSRSVKTRLTKSFRAVGTDSAIVPTRRQQLAAGARQLVGLQRRSIKAITFKADGSVDAAFTNAQVDQDDADKWAASLEPGT